jgi:6-pyruvoyltetrahydropterin/6-carboxytetrahydropterin synthase
MQEASYKILHLSKDNLKFSAAHFLIFDDSHAERLHGHNYRVTVDVKVHWQEFADAGYGVDFGILKTKIKAQLDQWDECVLLPAKHKDIKIQVTEESLDLRFRERHYVFPKNEVVLLPLINTSVELLSGLLCQNIWLELNNLGISGLTVQVEETCGQSAKSSIDRVC